MLEAINISKQFGNKIILHSVSISVKAGEIVGLVGPNGAGKTTSFYILVGLLKADKGEIYLEKENITKKPLYKRARKGLCYLPQNSSIFKKLTVKENLHCAMEVKKLKKDKRDQLTRELLKKFSIRKIENSYGYSLSGGERRKVEIARTLILSPKFLLLDEPFSGIDPVTIQDIKKIIKTLSAEGIGILITDHNVREALEICEKVYVLSEGSILAEGGPNSILSNEKVREVYLGTNFKI
jgi:lipopolysaccharide export system ATP-binding protein